VNGVNVLTVDGQQEILYVSWFTLDARAVTLTM
jgi:hypothetical protein